MCESATGLFVVADGMGGHAGGDTASRLAVASVCDQVAVRLPGDPDRSRSGTKARLRRVLDHANTAICAEAAATPALRDMATTVVVLLLRGGIAFVAFAGDSRAYLLRGRTLRQVSVDHSVAAHLVRLGKLTPEQAARNPFADTLEEYLGKPTAVRAGCRSRVLRHADRWLLCSDGLAHALSHADLSALLSQRQSPKRTCNALVEAALAVDPSDNITAVVIDVAATDSTSN